MKQVRLASLLVLLTQSLACGSDEVDLNLAAGSVDHLSVSSDPEGDPTFELKGIEATYTITVASWPRETRSSVFSSTSRVGGVRTAVELSEGWVFSDFSEANAITISAETISGNLFLVVYRSPGRDWELLAPPETAWTYLELQRRTAAAGDENVLFSYEGRYTAGQIDDEAPLPAKKSTRGPVVFERDTEVRLVALSRRPRFWNYVWADRGGFVASDAAGLFMQRR